MKTFLMFGKASPKELKEIGLKYKAEVVNLMGNFGGGCNVNLCNAPGKIFGFDSCIPGDEQSHQSLRGLKQIDRNFI